MVLCVYVGGSCRLRPTVFPELKPIVIPEPYVQIYQAVPSLIVTKAGH